MAEPEDLGRGVEVVGLVFGLEAAGLAAAGTGTAATYYRIWDSAGTTCFIQGTVTATGGGGDMTMDNTSIAENQVVTVNTFSIAAGNA